MNCSERWQCSWAQLLQTCSFQWHNLKRSSILVYLTLIHCWLTDSDRALDVCSCQDAAMQECSGPCLQSGNNVREPVLFVEPWFVSFSSRWSQWEWDFWVAQQSAVLETRPSAPQTVSAHGFSVPLWQASTQKTKPLHYKELYWHTRMLTGPQLCFSAAAWSLESDEQFLWSVSAVPWPKKLWERAPSHGQWQSLPSLCVCFLYFFSSCIPSRLREVW